MWLGTVGCPTIKSSCVENSSARLNDWFLGYQSLAVSRLVVTVAQRQFTLAEAASQTVHPFPRKASHILYAHSHQKQKLEPSYQQQKKANTQVVFIQTKARQQRKKAA